MRNVLIWASIVVGAFTISSQRREPAPLRSRLIMAGGAVLLYMAGVLRGVGL